MTVLHLPTDLEQDAATISGPELAQRAGITYRQLDHWTRAGYLTAIPRDRGGPGHPRVFSTTEIPRALLMARLVATGFNPLAAAITTTDLLTLGHADIGGITVHLPEPL